ncbi:hypothetical protein ACFQY4_00820 [Catellatospora bangladeshensis]|uniref:Uncharacterized protein n=1 Tax=Catellatospora bangladeshensis TaxID=310355 RepID=A0A8J3NJA7_9ACTN|nr:hypothetical protein [Catellatospora bangladeshensis]BCJ71630.1 hypothetical protein CS0771_11740 [Catellatospora sp. IY07-71]GIF81266.1 hypothetical protein Cba03nite_26150 [Catellatospora bangladeshensis]
MSIMKKMRTRSRSAEQIHLERPHAERAQRRRAAELGDPMAAVFVRLH